MNRHTYICVPCRYVAKSRGSGRTCPRCGAALRHMGYWWRPPKKGDDRAWRNIERGLYLWDEKALGGTLLTSRFAPIRAQIRNRMRSRGVPIDRLRPRRRAGR